MATAVLGIGADGVLLGPGVDEEEAPAVSAVRACCKALVRAVAAGDKNAWKSFYARNCVRRLPNSARPDRREQVAGIDEDQAKERCLVLRKVTKKGSEVEAEVALSTHARESKGTSRCSRHVGTLIWTRVDGRWLITEEVIRRQEG